MCCQQVLRATRQLQCQGFSAAALAEENRGNLSGQAIPTNAHCYVHPAVCAIPSHRHGFSLDSHLGVQTAQLQLPTGRVRPKRSRKEDPMLITDSTMVRAKGAVRTQIQRLNLSIGLVSLSKGCASPSIPSLGPQGTASKQCPPRRF